MTESSLNQLFKFTVDDLHTNRQGHMSVAQQQRWANAGQWAGTMTTTVIPLIVSIFIAVVGLIISVIVEQIVVGGILSLLLASVVGLGTRLALGRNGRSETPQQGTAVQRAEGIAHLRETVDHSKHGASRHYQLEIEHHTFPLFRKEQFEALENGARYIVYYLDDDSKYILSLEQIN